MINTLVNINVTNVKRELMSQTNLTQSLKETKKFYEFKEVNIIYALPVCRRMTKTKTIARI